MAWSVLKNKPSRGEGYRARASERFAAHGLTCALGEVVDLSISGMRVRCASKPAWPKGLPQTITIENGGQTVRVSGRIAWTRRQGLRTVLAGVQFIDVRPGIAAALRQLGQYGFIATDSPTVDTKTGWTTGGAATAKIEVEDLYSILGVAASADGDEIRSAYRELARRLHPDVAADADTSDRFARISKAYSVLRDPAMRKKYDGMVMRCRAA